MPLPPADAVLTAAAARHAALAVSSRRRLLEHLQVAGAALDADQLAKQVGLHVTTTRTHLAILERAGLVGRAVEPPARPGRPRQLYTALPPAGATEGHRQLAEVLAAALSTDAQEGPRRAERAGQRWAEAQVPALLSISSADAGRRVAELFMSLGFAPRQRDTERGTLIELNACPFRDVARAHPEVVCTVHLGLLRGALRRFGVPPRQARLAGLRPFVEPELCVADIPLRPRRRPGSPTP